MRRLLRDRSRRFLLDDYVLVDFEDLQDTLHRRLRFTQPSDAAVFVRRFHKDLTALHELRQGVLATVPDPLAFRRGDRSVLDSAAALLGRGPLRLLERQPAKPLFPVRWHEPAKP